MCRRPNETPRHSYCLPCFREINATARKYNRLRTSDQVEAARRECGNMKWCRQCGERLSLREFYADPSTRLGVGSQCKQCVRRRRNDARRNKGATRAD